MLWNFDNVTSLINIICDKVQERPQVHPPTFNHRIVYQKERSTGGKTLSLKKNHRDLCRDLTPRLWVNPFFFFFFFFLLWIPVARLQDERRSRWWAGRFPFIGVPRDVIVLSVSIAPLVFPQIAARCKAWVTMLECIAPVSRRRKHQDRLAVWRNASGYILLFPGASAGYAPGKSCAIDGFCCDYRGHVLFFKWYTDHIMSAAACCAVWLSRGCFI